MSEIYCKECGKQVSAEATTCPFCGVQLNEVPVAEPVAEPATATAANVSEKSDRDWLTTFLLCWFLGYLGLHSFYAKKTGIGIIQLLTVGGCGIWTFIDFWMLIFGAYRDGEGKIVGRR